MRSERRETRKVPRTFVETDYACDGCGKTISRDDHDDGYAHELEIRLDQDECVNYFRQRDYCPACLEPIWQKINELLKSDPDAERDRDYE